MNDDTERRMRAAWMASSKGTVALIVELTVRFDCRVRDVMRVIFEDRWPR